MGYYVIRENFPKILKQLFDVFDGKFTIQHDLPFDLMVYTECGRFRLLQHPTCCGILISSDSFIKDNFRNQGFGTRYMELKIEIAKEFNYSIMSCSVINGKLIGNKYVKPATFEYEEKILNKFKWKKVNVFVNKRTQNEISEYVLQL
jgi:predicted GNAT family acetyltransferase